MDGLILALLLPVAGTTLGSACVFFMRRQMNMSLYRVLLGFASGVMVAASVWSLIIPALDSDGGEGVFRVVLVSAGVMSGFLVLLAMDHFTPHMHVDQREEGPKSHMSATKKLVMAVTIHNIPEGLAVGATIAGVLEHNAFIPLAGALTLSIGIAIQNFPEGAIVSMPLRNVGNSRLKSFRIGTLTGLVEPVAAVLTVLFATWVAPALPFLLAFAAGTMLYVVVEELIPTASEGAHSNMATLGFAAGFVLMMILDVVLG